MSSTTGQEDPLSSEWHGHYVVQKPVFVWVPVVAGLVLGQLASMVFNPDWFFPLSGLLLLTTILMIYNHFSGRTELFLNDQGFLFVDGKRRLNSAWDQVLATKDHRYFLPLHNFTEHARSYKVRLVSGSLNLVSTFFRGFWVWDRFSDLVTEMEKKVMEHLLPRLQKQFETGGEVSFGRLQVSRQSLVYQNRRFSWSEVKDLQIFPCTDRLRLQIRKPGSGHRWTTVQWGHLENTEILRLVLGKLR